MRSRKNYIKSNLLNTIRVTAPQRNLFDLSHYVLTSFNMGKLVPVLAHECVPGDTYTLGTETLIRLQPLVSPIMHKVTCRVENYFVPYRIIFKEWEEFITNKSVVAAPTLAVSPANYDASRLYDYLFLPRPETDPYTVNALNFAAYQAIYNEFYRDQNLQPEVNYQLVPGANDANLDLTVLRNRAWEHDRFTSALPFPQKGQAVDIPLGVIPPTEVKFNDDNSDFMEFDVREDGTTPGIAVVVSEENADIDPQHIYVPESNVVPTTINELRISYALQRYYELFARAGSRYYEYLKSFFGVVTSDARLQRPEYIVGIKSPIIVSEVLNNTGEEGGLPQGNMAGHGVQYINGNLATYNCEEHGVIIAVASVIPDTMYQQGVPKSYLRGQPTDYYTPQFDHIGEEPILNMEVFIDGVRNGTFGYTPRNSDFKVAVNRVCGDFKTTLAHWHLGRIFATAPALNGTFISSDPSKRVFAVVDENEDAVLMQVCHKMMAKRPMSRYSTPI